MNKWQMMEFGQIVFKIYEEQFEEIRKAYEEYEGIDANARFWDAAHIAGTYHKFFKALYEQVEENKEKEAERLKKMDEEHERIIERSNDPAWVEGMKQLIDSFNKKEINNDL